MKINKEQLREMVRKVVKERLQEQLGGHSARQEAFEYIDQMKEIMGAEDLLDELGRALPADELLEMLKSIVRDWDLPIGDEEE